MIKLIILLTLTLLTSHGTEAKNKLSLAYLTFDGLHVTADGQRFAADGIDGTNVYRISDSGVVTVYASGLAGPVDITSDSAGNLYVTNFNSAMVTKIEPTGVTSDFAATNEGPSGITSDADDNIYVTHYGPVAGGGLTILKMTPAGEVYTYAEGGLLNTMVGLTIDDESNLYAANFNTGEVIKVSPEGFQSQIALIPSAYGYAIGHLEFANNRVFATGLIDQKIYVIKRNGTLKVRDVVTEGEYPNGLAFDPVRSEVIFTNTFAPSFGFDRIKIKPKVSDSE